MEVNLYVKDGEWVLEKAPDCVWEIKKWFPLSEENLTLTISNKKTDGSIPLYFAWPSYMLDNLYYYTDGEGMVEIPCYWYDDKVDLRDDIYIKKKL